MANKAVFLIRDGVINRVLVGNGKLRAPRTPEEFEPVPPRNGYGWEAKTFETPGICVLELAGYW